MRAVYGFVVTQVRYVGLEFGIHGYKPYRVDQVLQRRFGDCKDKASLMHALLAALGVDSRLVLLRMHRLGNIPEAPASLAPFNHAILYVPALDRWLDGTAAYTGSARAPGRGSRRHGPGDRAGRPAALRPRRRRRARRRTWSSRSTRSPSRPSGEAAIDGRSHDRGRAGLPLPPILRGRLRPAGAAGAGLRPRLGGGARRGGRDEPAREARGAGPAPLPAHRRRPSRSAEGDALRFTPFGAQRGYTERWGRARGAAPPARRRRPRTRTASPTGSRCRAAGRPTRSPRPRRSTGRHAAFALRYRAEPGAVVVEGQFTLKARRVPVADYAAFREFTAAADAAFDADDPASRRAARGQEAP